MRFDHYFGHFGGPSTQRVQEPPSGPPEGEPLGPLRISELLSFEGP